MHHRLVQVGSVTPTSDDLLMRSFVDFCNNAHKLPDDLAQLFEVDRSEDLYKDQNLHGGPSRTGDLTRPLNNRKINWIYRHWWSNDLSYIFERHTGCTFYLTRKQLQCLAPGHEPEDDVVNAYMELVKLRERHFWERSHDLRPPAKRYTAPSFFLFQALDLCGNLNT
ncbi:uncharacterized protein LOC141670462 isoform X2 [Apium graveolens]|uniref:uncharacterized protein LOC141670462 isoform X2 n=1 Tax=Apium graveolens TaxID=4045 RepID=UPI003D7BAD9B